MRYLTLIAALVLSGCAMGPSPIFEPIVPTVPMAKKVPRSEPILPPQPRHLVFTWDHSYPPADGVKVWYNLRQGPSLDIPVRQWPIIAVVATNYYKMEQPSVGDGFFFVTATNSEWGFEWQFPGEEIPVVPILP